MSRKKKTEDLTISDSTEIDGTPIQQILAYFKDKEGDGYYGTAYESADSGFEDEIKITTGSKNLDIQLDGGFNAFSMSMFFGDEECGKTAQGLAWGKNWQDHFGEKAYVVIYDAEGRLTRKKIRMSGIDTSRFSHVKSNAVEYVLQNILDLINNNPHGYKYFFIVDSINALTTADERSKSLEQAEARAGVARVNSMAFKKMSLPIHVLGHHLYLCSQVRAGNMTGFGGAGNKPGGGKAVAFYGDLVAKMGLAWNGQSPRYIKEGEKIIGRYTEFDFRKTYNESTGVKVAVPIKYDHVGGVWAANEIVDLALSWGLAVAKGSWFNFQSELLKDVAEKAGVDTALLDKKVQGHFGFVSYLENNPDLANLIYQYIFEMMK